MAVKTNEEKKISLEDLAQMMSGMKDELESLKKENEELKSKKHDAPNPIPANDPSLEELVPVQLFKDKNKYKDDVFIAINGQRVQIQRGVPVMLPKKYAMVLERSMVQDAETADLIEYETSEWDRKAKLLNL